MTLLQALNESAPFLLFSATLLGLIIGSFLNVVIHRLPLMMEQNWKSECRSLLELDEQPQERLSLVTPRSACPSCGRMIRAIENVPLLSYLALRGRCAGCGSGISIQYPLVELACGLLSAWVTWHFGVSVQALAGLFLTWALISLTMIDIRHQLLPDSITLPLLWAGLLLNTAGVFVDLESSVIGAAAGYLSLWSVYQLFKLATGKEGMGFGDFKLLAVFGAWFGWQCLPVVILLSSVVGAVVGISILTLSRKDSDTPLPFGPYLAVAGWVAMLYGDALTQGYLSATGLS